LDTWLAIGCGLAGVVIIQQPKLAQGEYALLAAAAGSFTTSIAMLGLHRLKHLHPTSIVAHFSAVSVLFCLAALWIWPQQLVEILPASRFAEAPVSSAAEEPEHFGPANLLALAGVGITATLGQLFLTKAFAAGSPARVSVVGLSQVAFTAAADMVFWQRHFQATTIIGMVFIVLPTLWLLVRSSAPDTAEVIPEKPAVVPPLE
jgi:drug/metabolite transporter (DMT)-like permease